MRHYTEEEDLVLRKYYGKKSYKEIARILDRSKESVKNRCKMLGIQESNRWTDEEVDILKNHYPNNPNITELLPNRTWECIKKKANLMGLKLRYGRYKFNHDFFQPLTPTSAYVLGFIAADGYINLSAHRIEIALAQKDYDHLNNIRMAMEYEGPIYKRKKTKAVRFHITSYKMINDIVYLLNLTDPSNKTFELREPNIPSDLYKYYILGYVDGDGYLRHKDKYMRILGTEKILTWINSVFADNVDEVPHNKQPKRKGLENVYIISYTGNVACRIMDWLYDGQVNIYLKRKHDRYLSWHCR